MTESVYSNIPVESLLEWAGQTRDLELQALDGNLPGCLQDCEAELDAHEQILQQLEAKQKEVIRAQAEAERLYLEKGLDPGVQGLADKMKQLQEEWGGTTRAIMARQKALEERLVILGALSDDIEDQFIWINKVQLGIEEAEEPSVDINHLIDDINNIKVSS